MGALRHARIFVNHKCQSHGNKHHRVHAVRGKGYMRSQESTSIEYVASAYYCMYYSCFFSLNSFNSSRGSCYFNRPVEASPCPTGQMVLEYHNRFVRRGGEGLILITGTYLGLAILGLKFIFIGVISPKNSFIVR